jgi:hypothetical protein
MKKIVLATILSLALVTALPIAAFAHGRCGGYVGVSARQTVGLCAVPDCDITGYHYHDGVLCAGPFNGRSRGCH